MNQSLTDAEAYTAYTPLPLKQDFFTALAEVHENLSEAVSDDPAPDVLK